MLLTNHRILFEYLFLAVCGLRVTLGQSPSSPCPAVFSYQQDAGRWYGLIVGSLRGDTAYGQEIKTIIKMEYDGILRNNDIRDIVKLASDDELHQVVDRGDSLRYRVDLNAYPLPRVFEIQFNGRILCESPRGVHALHDVTTVRRDHTLHLNGFYGEYNSSTNESFRDASTSSPLEHVSHEIEIIKAFRSVMRPSAPAVLNSSMGSIFHEVTGHQSSSSTEGYFEISRGDIFQAARPVMRPSAPAGYSVECGVQDESMFKPTKLIAGAQRTESGDWPWLVALFHGGIKGRQFQCGASLLGKRFIITAAHCLYHATGEQVDIENIFIIAGASDVSLETNSEEFRSLSAIYVHEEYDARTTLNDIALLVLEKPLTHSKLIKPICLWEGDDDQSYLVGKNGMVVGWGDTGNGPSLKVPLRIAVPFVSLITCRGQNPRFFDLTNDKSLCAGKKDQTGPCKGDSGSGLFVEQNKRWRLRGVVSISLETICGPNTYVVYTDVAKFKDWINYKIINHF